LLVDRGKVLIHSWVKHQFTLQFKALSDLPWLTVMNYMTMSIRTLTVNDASVARLSESEMLIMLHITLPVAPEAVWQPPYQSEIRYGGAIPIR